MIEINLCTISTGRPSAQCTEGDDPPEGEDGPARRPPCEFAGLSAAIMWATGAFEHVERGFEEPRVHSTYVPSAEGPCRG